MLPINYYIALQKLLTPTPFVPEFEQRMTLEKPPFITNKDGTISTHKMAWGNDDKGYYAFPTIVNINGKLTELSPQDANRFAHKNNELKRFKTKKEAQEYAAGGWKKGKGKLYRREK